MHIFHPQTLFNTDGKANFVVLPIQEWQIIEQLLPLLVLLQTIQESLQEIRLEQQKTNRTFTSISDFIDECED